MLNNYLNYLKSLSNIKELDYVTIKNKILSLLPNICSKVKEANTGSMYAFFPCGRQVYGTFRIANHYPFLNNMFSNSKFTLTDVKYANICLLFFGSTDATNILNKQPNYEITNKNIKVLISRPRYNFLRNMYSAEPSVTYRIYHYIPNFLVESDIELIAESVNEWIADGGKIEYRHPDGLKPEAIGAGDIVTQVHFKLIGQNESVNNRNTKDLNEVNIIAGGQIGNSLMDISLGTIAFVEEETNEPLGEVEVTMSVTEASKEHLDMLQAIYSGSKKHNKSRLTENQKRELYNSIMLDVAKVVKKRLNDFDLEKDDNNSPLSEVYSEIDYNDDDD